MSHPESQRLFELAQRLLRLEPGAAPGNALAQPFEGVFGITSVCWFDGDTGAAFSAGRSEPELAARTRATYIAGADQDDREAQFTIRRLELGGRILGAVGFKGLEDPARTAEPLVKLAATLQERARKRRQETEAAVAAEVDAFRSAIFDVLGGECKNALTTILAAIGALREVGALRAPQVEMARMVEEEASRLGSLLSRLDWIARIDQEAVAPRLDTVEMTPLVEQAVNQWSRTETDRRIVLESARVPVKALADPELIKLALHQMLDNACKFSAPGAAIQVETGLEIGAQGGMVVVGVSSAGVPIPATEQERIFERFYRSSPEANFAAGSGLGLHAARKIAIAHGGSLGLDPGRMRSSRIAFRLCLRAASGE